MATSTRGTYSGRLQMGAKRYSFKGTFDLNGNATNTVLRLNSTSLTVRLHLSSGQETNHITGTVTDGSWSAALAGARSTFNARTKPAPLAGSYTLILPGNSSNPSVPAGDGFGTIKVSTSGLLRFAGTLSDGSRVSQGAWLSPEGKWPLYASLYSGNGSLVSWQDFTAQTSDDVHGLLSWIKNADARALYYPSGFTTELNAEGSVYHQPSTGSQKILAIGNGKAEFTGGRVGQRI